MDSQERDATFGRVFGFILILADATIDQKAHELVEQITQVLFQKLRVEHANVV